MKQRRTHPQRRRKTITMEIRREWVLMYRMQGLTNRQIAQNLKYQHGVSVSHVTVNTDWKAALATRRDENDEDWQNLRDIQNARYERLLVTWFPLALAGNPRAAEIILRIMKGIREINGLDREIGSVKNPLTVHYEGDDYDLSKLTNEELELMAELGDKARVIPSPRNGIP